jgi:SAM-dependent methyltransferase
MKGDDRAAALRANLATYENRDERAYINGAPHLKHPSIGSIYSSLVDDAIRSIGRKPEDITVLELGAGSGLASIPWLERHVRLTAVDSSESMLRDFRRRADAHGTTAQTVVADVLDYLGSTEEKFDVVTHVSMLHHIPDYLGLLRQSTAHVAPGGSLLTFQDPLRYDTVALHHRFVDGASYYAWRLRQGNYKRGLMTRWRRLRGVYSEKESVDFDEYHVVRSGVDSAAIMAQLEAPFADVRIVSYWSTYAAPLQWIGERMRLVSYFGTLASGRKAG